MKYKLVGFDFDGTLADSGAWFGNVMNQLAVEFGFKQLPECDRDKVRGYDTRAILKYLEVPMWKLPAIMTRVRKLAAQDHSHVRLFPGVEELLEELQRAEVTIAIVSSNAENTIRDILGPRIAARVSHYACGTSLFGKGAKLKALLRKVKVQPADAIYIGDETRDVTAARDAKMAVGVVGWGYAHPDALRALAPDFFFADVPEVLEKLRSGSRRLPIT